jgi:hypothetical protein
VDGTDQQHPARGKNLIRIGHHIGVPVGLALDPSEHVLHDTDGAMKLTGLRERGAEPEVAA